MKPVSPRKQAFFMENHMHNLILPLLMVLFLASCESVTLEDPASYPNLKITDITVGKGAQPAEMGYGSRSVGSIPANSTLIFEVELLNVY